MAKVCIANIIGPHGLDGTVKIKSNLVYPEDIMHFTDITDSLGQGPFQIEIIGKPYKGVIRAKIRGIVSRELAEKLSHTDLYVNAENQVDVHVFDSVEQELHNLSVYVRSYERYLGKVIAVESHGAQDLIKVEGTVDGGHKKSWLIPHTPSIVTAIDKEANKMLIDPPEGLLDL